MDHKRISELVTAIDRMKPVKAVFKKPEIGGAHAAISAYGCMYYGCFDINPLQPFFEGLIPEINERLDAERKRLMALYEAQLKGEICPEPEPRPDAYLDPVFDALGRHRGQNADWIGCAWPLRQDGEGSVWLLDDESPGNTVSIVSRFEGGAEPNLITILSGSVETVLPVALAIVGRK